MKAKEKATQIFDYFNELGYKKEFTIKLCKIAINEIIQEIATGMKLDFMMLRQNYPACINDWAEVKKEIENY